MAQPYDIGGRRLVGVRYHPRNSAAQLSQLKRFSHYRKFDVRFGQGLSVASDEQDRQARFAFADSTCKRDLLTVPETASSGHKAARSVACSNESDGYNLRAFAGSLFRRACTRRP